MRSTSATILADEGADRLVLKRHGTWRTDGVVEKYLRNSKKMKTDVGNMLMGSSEKPGNDDIPVSHHSFTIAGCTVNKMTINIVQQAPAVKRISDQESAEIQLLD